MSIVKHLFYRLVITAICIVFGLYSGIFAQSATPHPIILPANNAVIPLYWQGDSVAGAWTSYAALLIPVKIPDCPRIFYMQFDTGSPYSLLYTNMLKEIQLKYPRAFPQNIASGTLKDFKCTAGHTLISVKEMVVASFDTTAIYWNDTSKPQIIGTFGTDLIDNKIIVFDYPQHRLIISDTLTTLAHKFAFSPFIYSNHSILIPVTIRGKTTYVFFDTGASMFRLVIDKETCISLADTGSTASSFRVPSWEKEMTAFTFNSKDTIKISGLQLPLYTVTYMEGAQQSQINRMRAMGIGGLTGNALFVDRILVLDTKQQRFGFIH